MLSSPPSFASEEEVAQEVPLAAPATPPAGQDNQEPPSLSTAVAAKRRARSRREIRLSAAQLEQMESTLPSAGAFHDTSTHPNFQVRTTRIALTFARCPIALEEVFSQLAAGSKAIKGMRGVIEPHRDGTPHVHVIVQKRNSAIPYRNLMLQQQGVVYRCDIRTLSTKKYQLNWHEYVSKHSVPCNWGEYEVPLLKQTKTAQELVTTARDSGIPEALQDFIEGGGLQHVSAVRRGLEIMTTNGESTVRFVPPPLSLRLRPWQVDLLAKLNSMPKVRRIFWVWGPPKSGKTTFTRYLEQEYSGGIVNMGECIEMARALQAYRGQALVIWDFPKSFDWGPLSHRVGTVLETFSEFGSWRRSTMYGGERVQLCNHVLVFANVPPIENVTHRHLDDYYIEDCLTDTEEGGPAPEELPGQSVGSSQASTLRMGPVYDPISGNLRQMAGGSADVARDRSRSR